MIEAVNSVVSNAPLIRGNADQVSQARSFAANPERVQEVPQAPFISPYIHVDLNFDTAVLQIRDSSTGDVIRQIPSQNQLEAYQRAQAATETRAAQLANQQAAIEAAALESRQVAQQQAQQQVQQQQQARQQAATAQQASAPATSALSGSLDSVSTQA